MKDNKEKNSKEYELIHIGKYTYAIERDAEIEDGGWCFEIYDEYESDNIRFSDETNPKYSWWLRELNMSYRKNSPKSFEFHRIMDGTCIKVVGTNNPSLEAYKNDLFPLPEWKNEFSPVNVIKFGQFCINQFQLFGNHDYNWSERLFEEFKPKKVVIEQDFKVIDWIF